MTSKEACLAFAKKRYAHLTVGLINETEEIWQAALEWAAKEQEPVTYRTVVNSGAYVYHSADRVPNEYGLKGEALYLHPAPIPPGWKLVPIEDLELIASLYDDHLSTSQNASNAYEASCIAKMLLLAAAPKYKELK